jgi:hypothetical protein
MMKMKMAVCVLISVLVAGWSAKAAETEKNKEGFPNNDVKFTYYFTMFSDRFDDMMDNAMSYDVSEWSGGEAFLTKNESGEIYWWISLEIVDFLSDPEAVRQAFREQGVEGVEEMYFISEPRRLNDGYVILARTKTEAYFMPILGRDYSGEGERYTEFGGFTDKKVYTPEEFRKLLEPRGAELRVRGETIECPIQPQIRYSVDALPARAVLEALGSEVIWRGETNTITFTVPKEGRVFQWRLDDEDPFGCDIYDENDEWFTSIAAEIEDGCTMAYWLDFPRFLREHFDVSPTVDYDNFVIDIVDMPVEAQD